MTWRDVAAKDVADASRSRTVWLVSALLLLVFVAFTAAYSYLGDDDFLIYLEGLANLIAVFLPLLAILLGYKSIAHERSSGSLLLTLSFPHSRRDLVVGKFVGRSLVLVVPTLVALVVAGGVAGYLYGTDGLVLYPWFLAITALYSVAFVGIAVGLSMSTTADRWITMGALGGYLLLVMLWDNFQTLTLLFLHRFDMRVLADVPDWALFARLLKPSEAYYRLLRAGFDVNLAEAYVVADVPVYVDWWAALAVLFVWTLLPLVLGFRRFDAADL